MEFYTAIIILFLFLVESQSVERTKDENTLKDLLLNQNTNGVINHTEDQTKDALSRVKRQYNYDPYDRSSYPYPYPLPIFLGGGGFAVGHGFGGRGFGGRGFGGRGIGGRGIGGRGAGGIGGHAGGVGGGHGGGGGGGGRG